MVLLAVVLLLLLGVMLLTVQLAPETLGSKVSGVHVNRNRVKFAARSTNVRPDVDRNRVQFAARSVNVRPNVEGRRVKMAFATIFLILIAALPVEDGLSSGKEPTETMSHRV